MFPVRSKGKATWLCTNKKAAAKVDNVVVVYLPDSLGPEPVDLTPSEGAGAAGIEKKKLYMWNTIK